MEDKLAVVLKGLNGKKSAPDICPGYKISKTLFYYWSRKGVKAKAAWSIKEKWPSWCSEFKKDYRWEPKVKGTHGERETKGAWRISYTASSSCNKVFESFRKASFGRLGNLHLEGIRKACWAFFHQGKTTTQIFEALELNGRRSGELRKEIREPIVCSSFWGDEETDTPKAIPKSVRFNESSFLISS